MVMLHAVILFQVTSPLPLNTSLPSDPGDCALRSAGHTSHPHTNFAAIAPIFAHLDACLAAAHPATVAVKSDL